LTAQIIAPRPPGSTDRSADSILSQGKFAPFNVEDLMAIAPWMTGKWGKINTGDGTPVLGT